MTRIDNGSLIKLTSTSAMLSCKYFPSFVKRNFPTDVMTGIYDRIHFQETTLSIAVFQAALQSNECNEQREEKTDSRHSVK
jgi:hypothetical protein